MVHSAHSGHGHGHPLPPVPSHPSALANSPHGFAAHLTPTLAPPPPAPHGPRQPPHAPARSRTPSPDRSSYTHSTTHYYHDGASDTVAHAVNTLRISDSDSQQSLGSDEEPRARTRPSAKALGKRRAPPPPDPDSTCCVFYMSDNS